MDALWQAAPDPALLAAVCAAVTVAAVLRGLAGFGFALAAVPLVSLVAPPQQAVAVIILLQVLMGVRDIATMHRIVDRRSLVPMSLGALVGTPPGVALLLVLDPSVTRIAIAVLVLAGLVMLLRTPERRLPRWMALPTGVLAGLFGGFAAMAGPPAVAYYLATGQPRETTRASLMVFFCITSVFAVPLLLWGGAIEVADVVMTLAAFPAFAIGTAIGTWLFHRTSASSYRAIAIATLIATSFAAAARGIADLL